VSFVLENGVGAYDEDPAQMAQIVAKWFSPGSKELEAMAVKAKLLGRPEATFNIVRELAGEPKESHKALRCALKILISFFCVALLTCVCFVCNRYGALKRAETSAANPTAAAASHWALDASSEPPSQ
jgi:hypothetical protein